MPPSSAYYSEAPGSRNHETAMLAGTSNGCRGACSHPRSRLTDSQRKGDHPLHRESSACPVTGRDPMGAGRLSSPVQQFNSESNRSHNALDRFSRSTRTRKSRRGRCPCTSPAATGDGRERHAWNSPRQVVRQAASIATGRLPSSQPRRLSLREGCVRSCAQPCFVQAPREGWRI